MSRAYIFPGQGSQFVGMGKDLNSSFVEAKEVFQEVDEALAQSLSKIMFEGPEEDLVLTENAQPALMAVSTALVNILKKQGDISIKQTSTFLAGHSLGEYSALVAADSILLADVAKLLKIRGKSMQESVSVGKGAMAAMIGSDLRIIENLIKDTLNKGEVCSIANDNAPGQVVISGHKTAVNRAIEASKDFGVKRSVFLSVSAPFHCSLMQPAADSMFDALSNVLVNKPSVPIISNVTARDVKDSSDIKSLLVSQVTNTVRWRESINFINENGVKELVELGAGKVLSGLARRINRENNSISLQSPEDIESFLKNF